MFGGLEAPLRARLSSARMLVALALSGAASAQDLSQYGAYLDATGYQAAPTDGSTSDPLMLWRVGGLDKGLYAVGAQLEYLNRPLVSQSQEINDSGVATPGSRNTVIGGLAGLRVGAAWQPLSRVGLGLSLPVWGYQVGAVPNEFGVSTAYSRGPTLGDAVLSVPVSLRGLDEEGKGLALGLVPSLTLPTGPSGRGLSDDAIGGSVVLAGTLVRDKISLDLNAGVRRRRTPGATEEFPVQGVLGGIGGLSVSYAVSDNLGVMVGAHAGGALIARFEPQEGFVNVPDDQLVVPAEISLGVRGRTEAGLFWNAGLASGGGGPGASSPHVVAGAGWSPRPKEAVVEPPPPEPPPLVDITFEVVDPSGAPVPAAVVSDPDETLGETGAEGTLVVKADTIDWSGTGVAVTAPGFVAVDAVAQPVDPAERVRIELAWAPAPARLLVTDQSGAAVPARISVQGLDIPLVSVSDDGVATFDLPPGEWIALIEAEGLGSQARGFTVSPGDVALQRAEAILLPDAAGLANLALTVTDANGQPLDGATVRLDGMPIGTSASGGLVRADGLAEGEHRVEVIHDAYQAVQLDSVMLKAGDNTLSVPLARMPGSVKVVARSGDAPVPDATVRFDGPSRLPPSELGSDGERIFVVRPGTWSVLVSSPEAGLQSRRIVVPPDRTELIVVEVNLLAEGGPADLNIQVVDPDGEPVNAARIELDGRSLGYTSTGGSMDVPDLNVGARSMTLTAENMRPIEAADLFLVEGQQQKLVTMDWMAGTTRVRALRTDGFVSDATASFTGPAAMEPVDLGPFGEETVQLAEGAWSALVVSPEHGLQARNLQVPKDGRRLNRLDVYLGGGEDAGGTNLSVAAVDPEGYPADNLTVVLDGNTIGRVVDGSLSLQDIGGGSRTLELSGSPFKAAKQDLTLSDGDNEVMVNLDWAPGAVKVITREPDGTPVTDATIAVIGPADVPSTRVDERGVRLLQLSAGDWQALVVSPSYGFVSRPVTIAPDQESLEVVEFEVIPVAEGRSELLVRVVDPLGKPIPNAKVLFDGGEIGKTGAGGTFLLDDVAPGTVSFDVEAAGFADLAAADLTLRAGSQDRLVTLDYVPAPIEITVTDKEGTPVLAQVQFSGPSDVAPLSTNAAGVGTTALRPGSWTILASAADLGVKATQVKLAPSLEVTKVTIALDAAKVKVTSEQVVIEEKVPFDFEKATLRASAGPLLDEVASTLIANPQVVRVEVQGHTDNIGSGSFNLQLSDRRAKAVYDALVERGVPPERLVSRGYGATRPVTTNDTDAGRAENRRVQFQILEQTGGSAE